MRFTFRRRRTRLSPTPGKIATSRLTIQNLEAREVPAFGLGIASDYSAFILNNLHGTYSDIQGRVAVGGNAYFTGYSVGDRLTDSDGTRDDLIVGGNLTYTNGQVFNGNVVYGGTGTFDMFGLPNGTKRQGTPLDFGAAAAELNNLSQTWSKLATNGSITNQWGIVTLVGTNATTNVFNLRADQLWNANTLSIKAPAGSTVLINVSGAEARMQYMGLSVEGTSKDEVVFNFHEATKLTLAGIGVLGSVMAPKAYVDFSNGNIQGTLVASSWCGNGEIEIGNPEIKVDVPCCGSTVMGRVYNDGNDNGVIDNGEWGLGGVCVTLCGRDADGNMVNITTKTDGTGAYYFRHLKAGTYAIKVHTPSGYTAGKSAVGAFGGYAKPNKICGIRVPACQESCGYNFGELCSV